MADIASLLTQSLALHNQAKALRRQKKPETARLALVTAAAYRREAHAADPEHTDPAWADEQGKTPNGRETHAIMMAFYTEQGV